MNLTDIDKDEFSKLIENNTYVELAKRFGVTDSAIRNKAKKLGIFKRRNSYNGHNRKIKEYYCNHCGKSLDGNRTYKNKYCDHKCHRDKIFEDYIVRWKEGKEDGIISTVEVSHHIRRYLKEKFNNKCCKCGWKEVNPYTGKVPIQINHIDGNCLNNKEENLEILCPNCHSLTPTWGGSNKTKGRRKIIKESEQ